MSRASVNQLRILEIRARSANAGPNRFYHKVAHVDDCLAKLDQVGDLNEHDRRILRWAILWHDIIYDPTRSDNEERSAQRAGHDLSAAGAARKDIEEVARLIHLTRGHRVAGDDRLGALMVSIDLSILGAEPARYRAYADAIRREYAHVPDELFRKGRTLVLEELLHAEPLFPNAGFRAALEEQARANMAAEIEQLSASPG